MLRHTSPYHLILLSGVFSLAILGFFILNRANNFDYVEGHTTEYHPNATQDRAAAVTALEEVGFIQSPEQAARNIFVPAFEGSQPVAIGTRLSHITMEGGRSNTVHAAISILAQEDGATDRAPLNIALVIDRSGSMHGSKMDFAKAASHALIDALGEQDRLSIVTYATEVTAETKPLAVTPATRGELHRVISTIDCYGGTNISGGIEQGRELVERAKSPASIDRVVLLSDGQANKGVSDEHGLRRIASDTLERGVSVTAMGMGLEYDEDVMQAIASAGAGNYYFIEDGSATERVFGEELTRLQSAVARDALLELQLGPGVLVTEVHGFPYRETKGAITVPLDAFAAAERKDLLIEFEVEASNGPTIFRSALRYTDVQKNSPVTKRSVARIPVGEVALNVDVVTRVQQIRTMRAFQDAMVQYDHGDRFAAAAIIERQQQDNRRFLRQAKLDDPAFNRVDKELGELADALRRTDRQTTKGKWIAKQTKYRASSAVYNEVVF